MGKMREVILFDAPLLRFCFQLLLGVLFRRAFLLGIDQKIAAVRFDYFVRGEPLLEQPDPFDIVFNQLPTLRHPPPPPLRRRWSTRSSDTQCDPIPSPLVSSTIHNMHFTPAVVLRPSSPHHHRLRVSFATDPHLSDASTFLRVQRVREVVLVVGLVLLGEIGVCLNSSAVAVSLVIVSVKESIVSYLL